MKEDPQDKYDYNRNDYDSGSNKKPERKSGGLILFLLILGVVIIVITVGRTSIGEKRLQLDLSAFQDQYNSDNIGSLVIVGADRLEGEFRKPQSDERAEKADNSKTYKYFYADVDRSYIEANIREWASRSRKRDVYDVNRVYATGENGEWVMDDKGHAVYRENVQRREWAPMTLKTEKPNEFLAQFLIHVFPWLLMIGLFWFLLLRQFKSSGGAGGILNFGRSRAIVSKGKTGVTFGDVAGVDEAKDEVQEVVEFLKNPEKFKQIGARIPHGVLLIGPPGTGKTLLAKAIAGEADVPFFSISGSDFVEMFVGVGASRVRDLFKRAKDNSPCIVFLDEIDAVGRKRGSGFGGGHDEREQTLNAILVEMDGFESDAGVIVIAATNRPDVLDPALRRPGRFDREITVDLPDLDGREQILRVHAKKVTLATDVDLRRLARATPTFSGAELANLINEAALLAALQGKTSVAMMHLEDARDKVRWGRQKKHRVMDEADQAVTAYHEAGHAVATMLLPGVDPLHKVTIIPRGMALGATMSLPEKDQYGIGKRSLLSQIKVLYAGRIAEELFCKDITSGAQNDIERATFLARKMVVDWGMSDGIGPVNYVPDSGYDIFHGGSPDTPSLSDKIAEKIEEEVRGILLGCYDEIRKLMEENKSKVELVAQALLRYETLSAIEVEQILSGVSMTEIREAPREKVLRTPREFEEEKAVQKKRGEDRVNPATGIPPESLPGPA